MRSSRTLPGHADRDRPATNSGAQKRARLASLAPEAAQQLADQQRDVLGALAQRRHHDAHHRQAEVEVGAEAALVHLGAQVAVGRRDHAHVDRPVDAGADARTSRFSSTRSSFGCRSSGSSPISSRKMVPPAASSNAPARRVCGAGERALLVAEQLALEQVGRDRAAVDDDERLARARAGAWIASAACPLPVPVSPSSSTVASLAAARSSSANEARAGTDVPSSSPNAVRSETSRRLLPSASSKRSLARAQPDQAAVAQERLLDDDAVDDRAVAAAEIDDVHAVRRQADLAVEARDRLVGDLQIVARRRPDRADVPGRLPGRGARPAVDDAQPEPADDRRPGRAPPPRAASCRAAPRRR